MFSLRIYFCLFCLFLFTTSAFARCVRTYYVQVEEADYDYAPSGRDNYHGLALDESPKASIFTKQSIGRIGKVYKKALYKEYTDDTFTVKKEQPKWAGGMGPILRAEVGDTIRVFFRNMASQPYSMHPHGVQYTHEMEGAAYTGNTAGGNSVAPNTSWTYVWNVPERSGPGPADVSSVLWMYHSHVKEAVDLYSGLYGPIIVYRPGMLDPERSVAVDVDEEIVVVLLIADENKSHYIRENTLRFAGDSTFRSDEGTNVKRPLDFNDPEFVESNMMHSINGRVWANVDGMVVQRGQRVRWYTASFGNENDLHTLHWHGQTLLYDGHRVDVVDMLPASFRVLDMVADEVGKWLVHCHVGDHMAGGMNAFFEVLPTDATSPRSVYSTADTDASSVSVFVIACVALAFGVLALASLAGYIFWRPQNADRTASGFKMLRESTSREIRRRFSEPSVLYTPNCNCDGESVAIMGKHEKQDDWC